MRKKRIALFLVIILVITMIEPINIFAISQNEVEVKLNSLIKQYCGTTWNGYYYGSQCKGFANLIFSDLFGVYIGAYDETTKSYIPKPNGAYEVGRLDANHMSVDGAKSILLKGMPGDYIQVRRRNKTWGHSMILVGTDSSGITVFDCNSDGKNGVRSYRIDWNEFYKDNSAMSLYHANNYTVITPNTDTCNCNESYQGKYIVTTPLNIRIGHGTEYKVLTTIPKGEIVYVSKADGSWAHVEWNGYSGYCSMQYLTKMSIGLRTWISDAEMGNEVSDYKKGKRYYFCYEICDINTRQRLNEILEISYKVTETIYKPDGAMAATKTYENIDGNCTGFLAESKGNYKAVIRVVINGVTETTTEFTVKPAGVENVQILNEKGYYCHNVLMKNIGDTVTLRAKITPDDAEDKAVTWTSSDSSVVSVDSNGKITAKKDGVAKIKVVTRDGNFSASCNVKVKTYGIIYGDCNDDGAVTATDLSVINQAANGAIKLSEEEKIVFDLNGDGVVNDVDVDLLKQFVLGTITSFPVEQQLSEIVISTMPKKTTYYIGDTITTEGITIKAIFNNGTSKDIKDFKVNGSTSVAGRQQVAISYTEAGITKSTSYQIYVKQKEVIEATMVPVVNPIETMRPTSIPTLVPQDTIKPTSISTLAPQNTIKPTSIPSLEPQNTIKPTIVPTKTPQEPTMIPTKTPQKPTMIPTKTPQEPTMIPTKIPQSPTNPTNTISPTIVPTITPIINPTMEPISSTDPADILTTETEEPDLEDLEGEDLEADTEKTLEKGDLFEVKGITYEVTNASEDNPTAECISSTSNKSKTIIIPAKVTYEDIDYKVTGIAKNAFKNNKRITTVTIGSNVTYIGAYAFYGNSKLKTVKIKSQKIKSIQKKAFFGMPKKVTVKVPANVKSKYKRMLKNAGFGKR